MKAWLVLVALAGAATAQSHVDIRRVSPELHRQLVDHRTRTLGAASRRKWIFANQDGIDVADPHLLEALRRSAPHLLQPSSDLHAAKFQLTIPAAQRAAVLEHALPPDATHLFFADPALRPLAPSQLRLSSALGSEVVVTPDSVAELRRLTPQALVLHQLSISPIDGVLSLDDRASRVLVIDASPRSRADAKRIYGPDSNVTIERMSFDTTGASVLEASNAEVVATIVAHPPKLHQVVVIGHVANGEVRFADGKGVPMGDLLKSGALVIGCNTADAHTTGINLSTSLEIRPRDAARITNQIIKAVADGVANRTPTVEFLMRRVQETVLPVCSGVGCTTLREAVVEAVST